MYNLSNGLYGNALIDTSDPFVAANLIESDYRCFINDLNNNGILLTEAEENDKTFWGRIKAFFKKILEFIKKIWEKIKGFFRKIRYKLSKKYREMVDKKRESEKSNKDSDDKSDNSSNSEYTVTEYEITNYMEWALAIDKSLDTLVDTWHIGQTAHALSVCKLEDWLEMYTKIHTDEVIEYVRDNINTVEYKVVADNKHVVESWLIARGGVCVWKSSFEDSNSNYKFKLNVTFDDAKNMAELSTKVTEVFNEIFKSINNHKDKFEIHVYNRDGSKEMHPFDMERTYFRASKLGDDNSITKKLDSAFKSIENEYKTIEKTIKEWIQQTENSANARVNDRKAAVAADDDDDEYSSARIKLNGANRKLNYIKEFNSYVTGVIGRVFPPLLNISTTVFTNYCKILDGCANNVSYIDSIYLQ